MNAFRSHGKGTLVLKGTFAGVKLERATGTNDPKTFALLESMCRTLADAGRLDLLEQVRDGHLKLLELWKFYRLGELHRIPTAAHAAELKSAFEAWALTLKGARHRQDMTLNLARLLELVGQQATVAELPLAVERYRARCQAAGTARMFNKVRYAAQAFLRDTTRKRSVLWQAVAAVPTLPVTPKFAKNPQRPAAAWTIAATLGGQPGIAWWVMCCTGMMPDEYFGEKFERAAVGLHVQGTKRIGRDRLVPAPLTPEPVALGYWGFRNALRRSGLGVTPYDARRTFRHLMGLVGLPKARREAYMGHASKDMDSLYDEVSGDTRDYYLRTDARKLDQVITKAIGMTAQQALEQLIGGISGGTPPRTRRKSMTRPGIEPGTYGLKVRDPSSPIAPRKQPHMGHGE